MRIMRSFKFREFYSRTKSDYLKVFEMFFSALNSEENKASVIQCNIFLRFNLMLQAKAPFESFLPSTHFIEVILKRKTTRKLIIYVYFEVQRHFTFYSKH